MFSEKVVDEVNFPAVPVIVSVDVPSMAALLALSDSTGKSVAGIEVDVFGRSGSLTHIHRAHPTECEGRRIDAQRKGRGLTLSRGMSHDGQCRIADGCSASGAQGQDRTCVGRVDRE